MNGWTSGKWIIYVRSSYLIGFLAVAALFLLLLSTVDPSLVRVAFFNSALLLSPSGLSSESENGSVHQNGWAALYENIDVFIAKHTEYWLAF